MREAQLAYVPANTATIAFPELSSSQVLAGEMAEWLKAHAWKACLLERVTWVRIPLSPPCFQCIRGGYTTIYTTLGGLPRGTGASMVFRPGAKATSATNQEKFPRKRTWLGER